MKLGKKIGETACQFISLEEFREFIKKIRPSSSVEEITRGDQIEMFEAGANRIIRNVIFLSLLYLLAWLTGTVYETLIVAISFATFRGLARGYHFDTENKCTFITLLIFVSSGVLGQKVHFSFEMLLVIVLVVFVIVVGLVWSYAPQDSLKRPLSNEKKTYYKKLSFVFVVLWTLVSIFIGMTRYRYLVIPSTIGVLWEAFSITPIGYKFLDLINKLLNCFFGGKATLMEE